MSGGGTYVTPGVTTIADVTLVEAAKRALKKPEGFMYYGNHVPDEGWGWVGLSAAKNEDDAINRSNLRVIYTDLADQWPDDVAVERTNHWAVGPLDELRVKVLIRGDEDITEDNITPAFRTMAAWAEKLAGYAVADESDYSDLETEEALAAGMVMCDNTGEWEFPSDCVRAGHEHDTEVNE